MAPEPKSHVLEASAVRAESTAVTLLERALDEAKASAERGNGDLSFAELIALAQAEAQIAISLRLGQLAEHVYDNTDALERFRQASEERPV